MTNTKVENHKNTKIRKHRNTEVQKYRNTKVVPPLAWWLAPRAFPRSGRMNGRCHHVLTAAACMHYHDYHRHQRYLRHHHHHCQHQIFSSLHTIHSQFIIVFSIIIILINSVIFSHLLLLSKAQVPLALSGCSLYLALAHIVLVAQIGIST